MIATYGTYRFYLSRKNPALWAKSSYKALLIFIQNDRRLQDQVGGCNFHVNPIYNLNRRSNYSYRHGRLIPIMNRIRIKKSQSED